MRILHVLDHSLPLHSGYAFRTMAILREQRRLGWVTRQLTGPRQGPTAGDDDSHDGVLFDRTPFAANQISAIPGARYVQEMWATGRNIVALARVFRPDVIHAHSPVLNGLPSVAAGRKLGIPVVYELRALWEDAAVDHGVTRDGSVRYRSSRLLESFVLHRADHVTTICGGLQNEIIARGMPPDRVSVVPNGVDLEDFKFDMPMDTTLAERLGIQGKIVVGFAGSFYAYEGLDLLVDAIGELSGTHRNVHALLIGGGPHEANLRERVGKQGLSSCITFVGRVPHEEMPRYYALIDVLAYPRRRMRLTDLVTPLKPLEAMAQGRIVVASDVGGHRELIRNLETGFLFAADDAAALADTLARVIAWRDRWPRMRDDARRYVELERNWQNCVSRYADVYESSRRSCRVRAVRAVA